MKVGLESVKDSLVAAKDGISSTKEQIFGVPVEPIEGGMPGRNHPHPETFETPAPTLMDKMKDSMDAVQVAVKPVLASAQTGFRKGKKRVWRKKVQPIEGGMPGRNHPHPERFYHYAGTPALPSKMNRSLASAQTGLLSAKNKIFGTRIQPIEGGMPGRNHPHAERFYAPTPTIMDRVKTGLTSTETGLLSVKKSVFGEKIVPIEGGMPGRNHPHPERFYAKAPTFMDRVQTAKHAVFGEKVVPIEGGMPGRNHPHPERFEVGFFTKIKENLFPERSGYEHKTEARPVELQAQSEIDTASIDQEAVKGQLESTLAKETIHPGQDMPGPGRNHPMHDSFHAEDESLLTKLSDKWKQYSVL